MPDVTIAPEFRRIARVLPRNVGRHPRLLRTPDGVVRLLDRVRRRDDLTVETVGEVTARVHVPPADVRGDGPMPGVVWIHGGGFLGGAAFQDDKICRRLAAELGAVVVAVDYRLAPEHPFPAPLDDCHDALVWLAARNDVDAARIAIAGASAGGGLAAQLALLCLERGQVSPVIQALVYPMLDDRTVLRDDIVEDGFRLWNNDANRAGWTAYLGQEPGGETVPTLAAPARHDDLSGVAPAWIGVGTLDLFHDEDIAYAERLRAAGVDCELEVIEGVFHAFDVVKSSAGTSERFRSSMIESLRSRLTAGV